MKASLVLSAAVMWATLGLSSAVAQTPRPLPIAFEVPYPPGQPPLAHDQSFARLQRQVRSQWNHGGRQTAWHPGPRIVVEVLGTGRKARRVQRTLRNRGYWPIRHCYEQSLRTDQTLRGTLNVRFRLTTKGRTSRIHVSKDRSFHAPNELTRCVTHALKGLRLSRPTERLNVRAKFHLRPGDAPVPAEVPPEAKNAPQAFDAAKLQAVVARQLNLPLQRCYRHGIAQVPGLWGRMALLARVTADGHVASVQEVESLFPSPSTTTCAAQALQATVFPAPNRAPAYVVIPIRLGHPPQH